MVVASSNWIGKVITVAVLAAPLFANAGATPRQIAFRPQDGRSLVVLAVSPRQYGPIVLFRSVDMDTGRFGRDLVSFNIMGKVINVEEYNTNNRISLLAAQEFPPGTYAIVEIGGSTGARTVAVACLNQRAPVYTFGPGQISIVRTEDAISGEASADQEPGEAFQRARMQHPEIEGPAAIASPRFITWQRTSSFSLTRACSEPPTFSNAP
jgi:hypothetical protein